MIEPIYITFLDIELGLFAIFYVLAILVSIVIVYLQKDLWLNNWERFYKSLILVVSLSFIGFLGCRILSIAENHGIDNLSNFNYQNIFDSNNGLVWYGGLILCFISLPIYYRILSPEVTFINLLDTITLACSISYSIGRLGCFLSGDSCFGTWTSLPWGVRLVHSSNPSFLPVHPTPLYESILGSILFFVLVQVKNKIYKEGIVLFTFLFISSLFRFFIEFIRRNEKYFLSLTLSQLISLSIIIITIIIIKSKKYEIKFS